VARLAELGGSVCRGWLIWADWCARSQTPPYIEVQRGVGQVGGVQDGLHDHVVEVLTHRLLLPLGVVAHAVTFAALTFAAQLHSPTARVAYSMLTTSYDAVSLNKRGFKAVRGVASMMCCIGPYPLPMEPSLGVSPTSTPSRSSRFNMPLCIARSVPMIRALHSFTFQLDVSDFCGKGVQLGVV
jgi:hypothetical protein